MLRQDILGEERGQETATPPSGAAGKDSRGPPQQSHEAGMRSPSPTTFPRLPCIKVEPHDQVLPREAVWKSCACPVLLGRVGRRYSDLFTVSSSTCWLGARDLEDGRATTQSHGPRTPPTARTRRRTAVTRGTTTALHHDTSGWLVTAASATLTHMAGCRKDTLATRPTLGPKSH